MTDFSRPGAHCERTVEIAAYLAGESSDADQLAMRAHADGCATCGPELTSFRALVDRVREVGRDELDDEWELTPTVGAGLFERALSEPTSDPAILGDARTIDLTGNSAAPGRSRRRIVAGLLAASMAFLAGAGSVVGVQRATKKSNPVQGETVKLQLISAKSAAPAVISDARAWAWISQTPGGTYATLYAKGLPVGPHYYMWFEKADGSRVALGSFHSDPDGKLWLKCPGSSALNREEIAAIGATANGKDVLRADLRAGAAVPVAKT